MTKLRYTSRKYSEAPGFLKAKNLLRRKSPPQFSAAEDLAFTKRGASEYSREMQGKSLLRRKRFFQFFMVSLLAKLTRAMTLTDPNDDKKKCNSVGLSLSWIDENN